MKSNREILVNALNNNELVSFLSLSASAFAERNVKIIYLQSDDVCNKEFLFETSEGERFARFENNVKFI